MADLVDIINVRNTLGEGVIWDERTQHIWWTDIEASILYRMALAGGNISIFHTPERLCSFGLTDKDNVLIAAFASGFAMYQCETGQVQPIEQPPELAAGRGLRLNDGRLDCRGRFWCGAMVEDAERTNDAGAALYCCDAQGNVSVKETRIGISNGICWSPAGDRFYFADSSNCTIYVYDFDADSGDITDRNIFATTPPGVSPDGAVTDEHGCLWSAHWGAGQVVRYTPDGVVDQTLRLPTCQPTCVAFGGAERELLFVTTARQELSEETLAQEPQAGNLFIYQLSVRGLPEPRYRKNGIM